MKKILFTALFLSGIAFLTPSAEAGGTQLVFAGYDRCGRPVYQRVYVPSYYQSRSNCSNAPVRYQSYNYGRSHQPVCRDSRPRFSVRFGF